MKASNFDSRSPRRTSGRWVSLLAAGVAVTALGASVATASGEEAVIAPEEEGPGAATATEAPGANSTTDVDASGSTANSAGGGGVAPPQAPVVKKLECMSRCAKTTTGTIGSRFQIIGSGLSGTRSISLPAANGKRVSATVKSGKVKPNANSVFATVPKGAISGRVNVFVVDSYGNRYNAESKGELKIGSAQAVKKAMAGYIFPVRGPHQYWDGLGAGRNHQGVDVGAKCGTPMVAAHGGRVIERAYHPAAGHYLIIDGHQTKHNYTYMHLPRPPLVRKHQSVYTGQRIGRVGDSGNASGCHLHFEMRIGSAWGRVINPMPHLKRWDSFS